MTREEIEELKGLAASMGLYDDKYPCKRAVILGKAIKALEQESCEDAISRQAVKELYYKDGYIGFRKICELPPVNPQTKMGLWIGIDEEPHEVWECDHCGFVIDGSGCIDPYDYRDTYKFCPNCGARMDEPQESEE